MSKISMPLLDKVSRIVSDEMLNMTRSSSLNRRKPSIGIAKNITINELELESRFNPDILPSTTKSLMPARFVKVPGRNESIHMLKQ